MTRVRGRPSRSALAGSREALSTMIASQGRAPRSAAAEPRHARAAPRELKLTMTTLTAAVMAPFRLDCGRMRASPEVEEQAAHLYVAPLADRAHARLVRRVDGRRADEHFLDGRVRQNGLQLVAAAFDGHADDPSQALPAIVVDERHRQAPPPLIGEELPHQDLAGHPGAVNRHPPSPRVADPCHLAQALHA